MEVARLARNQFVQYRLVGEQCSCGTKIFPPRDVCPECHTNLGQFHHNTGLELARQLDQEMKEREAQTLAQAALGVAGGAVSE